MYIIFNIYKVHGWRRHTDKTWVVNYYVNPFTAIDAMRLEVITHADICLTFADKYFYASQHSMHLF